MKCRLKWIAVWILAMPLAAGAQVSDGGNQAELIRELMSRIDKLESRVAQLEGQAAAKPATEAVVAHAEPAPPSAKPSEPGMEGMAGMPMAQSIGEDQSDLNASAANQPTYPSLKIRGFGDFDYSSTDKKGTSSGFSEGQFVLHMASALSPRVSYFGELSATARTDAGTGSPAAPQYNFTVERSLIRFDQSDYFKVSFGRYHTPINWWNTEFHHGTWLQTSITRPEMVEFGGTFIPVHFLGALVEGAIPAGGLNLNYNVGLGNGRDSADLSLAGDFGASNNYRAWLVNVFTRPDRFFGLQVGGSAYRDKINLPDGRDFLELITSGHIVWRRENPEFIAEFANINHQGINLSTNTNSQAFYVQIAYRLPWFEQKWKPYFRFEHIHIPESDIVFHGVIGSLDQAGSTFGVRYDISSFAAIKSEYRLLQPRLLGRPDVNGAFVQTDFTF